MKPPTFVRTLSKEERNRLEAGLRSKDTFALRRSQMLLASSRGEHVPRIIWTLEMGFERSLIEKRACGETIRTTLSRLLGMRWQRVKRWITSPDPLYERKKGGATG